MAAWHSTIWRKQGRIRGEELEDRANPADMELNKVQLEAGNISRAGAASMRRMKHY